MRAPLTLSAPPSRTRGVVLVIVAIVVLTVFSVGLSFGELFINWTAVGNARLAASAAADAIAAQPPPTHHPTHRPTHHPTLAPSRQPTAAPTGTTGPTRAPTLAPSRSPTAAPTATPTAAPTLAPTRSPTAAPTSIPSASVTASPTSTPAPTQVPSASPTRMPTPAPTPNPNPVAVTNQVQVDAFWTGFLNTLCGLNTLGCASLGHAPSFSDDAGPAYVTANLINGTSQRQTLDYIWPTWQAFAQTELHLGDPVAPVGVDPHLWLDAKQLFARPDYFDNWRATTTPKPAKCIALDRLMHHQQQSFLAQFVSIVRNESPQADTDLTWGFSYYLNPNATHAATVVARVVSEFGALQRHMTERIEADYLGQLDAFARSTYDFYLLRAPVEAERAVADRLCNARHTSALVNSQLVLQLALTFDPLSMQEQLAISDAIASLAGTACDYHSYLNQTLDGALSSRFVAPTGGNDTYWTVNNAVDCAHATTTSMVLTFSEPPQWTNDILNEITHTRDSASIALGMLFPVTDTHFPYPGWATAWLEFIPPPGSLPFLARPTTYCTPSSASFAFFTDLLDDFNAAWTFYAPLGMLDSYELRPTPVAHCQRPFSKFAVTLPSLGAVGHVGLGQSRVGPHMALEIGPLVAVHHTTRQIQRAYAQSQPSFLAQSAISSLFSPRSADGPMSTLIQHEMAQAGHAVFVERVVATRADFYNHTNERATALRDLWHATDRLLIPAITLAMHAGFMSVATVQSLATQLSWRPIDYTSPDRTSDDTTIETLYNRGPTSETLAYGVGYWRFLTLRNMLMSDCGMTNENATQLVHDAGLRYAQSMVAVVSAVRAYRARGCTGDLALPAPPPDMSVTLTVAPTNAPTSAPIDPLTYAPTNAPTATPTSAPTSAPTNTLNSTTVETMAPTSAPTSLPTSAPTSAPTAVPTSAPTVTPTSAPI